jgi:hypothetical protein
MLVGTSAALAATGAFLAPLTGSAAENSDAVLLAACAEFEAVERRIIEISDGPNAVEDDDEAERLTKPLWSQQSALLDKLDALPTHTQEGLRARLRLLSVHNEHGQYSWDAPDTISGRLLRQAVRQGSPGHPRVSQVKQHPDAELIALSAEAVQLEHDYRRLCWASDDTDERYNTPAGRRALARFNAVSARQDVVFGLLAELTPTTIAGLSAKARAVVAYYGNDTPNDDGLAAPAMWSVIEHLAERGGVA